MSPSMGGGSKGRTDMVISLEKQKIKDRQQRQRPAPERLMTEYQGTLESDASERMGSGYLGRAWRWVRNRIGGL